MKTAKFNFRVNHQIRAPEVRVIGSDGKQAGVMKLTEALSKAQEKDLDLVEIAPNARPPVVKIVELGKYKYDLEKKQRKQKKAKGGELKEIRFSPFIAENDYKVRIERINEFLDEKNKVRVVVKFLGRQMGSKQFGYNLIDRILSDLGGRVAVDMEPKFLGRHLITIISPTLDKKHNAKTKN